MFEEEESILDITGRKAKKIVKTVIKKKLKDDEVKLQLEFKAEKTRMIVLDVIVAITVFVYFLDFIFLPLFYKTYTKQANNLYTVLAKHFYDIKHNYLNIVIFFLFIGMLAVFFSFPENNFKHMGLVLLIAYITSLAVEAKMFITGAALNGIIVYAYVRIMKSINKKVLKNKKI